MRLASSAGPDSIRRSVQSRAGDLVRPQKGDYLRSPRLRRSMGMLGGMLLVVALVTACSLVMSTTVLINQTMRVSAADERTRSALRTKVALLWYARASDVVISARTAESWQKQAQAESELRTALQDTRRLAITEQSARVDNLNRNVDAYMAVRRQAEADSSPLGEVVERATPALEAAFNELDRLIASNDAWMRAVETSARRWDSAANVLGISAALLLLVGFVVAVVATSLLVERPLLALNAAMTRFANGDPTSRCVPRGALELQESGRVFNELANRLVRQTEDRLAFLAGVAHDLRNPLSVLALAAEGLRKGPQPPPEEKVTRTLANVSRQVALLDRMVGDLLDSIRVEAGRFELRLERPNLSAIVDHVVELFRPISDAHSIESLGSQAPTPPVTCDPVRIEQVLTNLVSNAIKYSPGGGRVTVTLASEGSDVVIAVTDQGIGIPPEERLRIFEPFHRTGQSRGVVPGVGLGLSVARKLVEAHGGRIEVESQLGKGSTFRVWLPALPVPPNSVPSP